MSAANVVAFKPSAMIATDLKTISQKNTNLFGVAEGVPASLFTGLVNPGYKHIVVNLANFIGMVCLLKKLRNFQQMKKYICTLI